MLYTNFGPIIVIVIAILIAMVVVVMAKAFWRGINSLAQVCTVNTANEDVRVNNKQATANKSKPKKPLSFPAHSTGKAMMTPTSELINSANSGRESTLINSSDLETPTWLRKYPTGIVSESLDGNLTISNDEAPVSSQDFVAEVCEPEVLSVQSETAQSTEGEPEVSRGEVKIMTAPTVNNDCDASRQTEVFC
ncbi:hypothetical protein [Shewanella sp. MBTL60-007]|uniref:hypothetical protein n=1 Tax=Shewanella sp. MBTL60-007 TaxID=2815911 RepID=UPI001BBAAFD9|nr:hypothetical protein [Shewanella sp. MBTL60-007]GIU31481.1 hypothetical protein TUM3792_43250 [Shewanella sp. MBTL60-007]